MNRYNSIQKLYLKNNLSDIITTISIWIVFIIVSSIFLWIVGTIFINGIGQISFSFLTDAPSNSGRSGGIGPILVSTLAILFVCISVSIPIGISTAILLSEFTKNENLFGRFIRRSLDVLAGIPSIVFGLFGNAFFSQVLGLGFSILSGGLTLACMVLPLLIRSTEEGLRSVPLSYRYSAAALGISKSTMIFKLLIPAATPGLIAGIVLGIGRAIAETAALLFTSGYVDRMPTSILDSGRSLSVHIFDLSMNVPGGNERAYASAMVLISLLILINGISTFIANRWIKGRITIT